MPGLLARAPVQLGEGHEALGQAADDRERHRQTEHARRAPPTRAQPPTATQTGKRLLQRPRVDAAVVDRGAVAAGPADLLGLAQREQQPQLLLEQLVVVAQVVAEERERLDERAAAGHDLGAPAREQVERREVLEDANRVVGADARRRRS